MCKGESKNGDDEGRTGEDIYQVYDKELDKLFRSGLDLSARYVLLVYKIHFFEFVKSLQL